jgi:hypothetical protein
MHDAVHKNTTTNCVAKISRLSIKAVSQIKKRTASWQAGRQHNYVDSSLCHLLRIKTSSLRGLGGLVGLCVRGGAPVLVSSAQIDGENKKTIAVRGPITQKFGWNFNVTSL